MKRRVRFATADFDFCSLQLSLGAGGVVNFLLAENVIEDEDESTREMGRGQLPKFGAVWENAQANLWDGSGSGKRGRNVDSRMWLVVFLAVSDWQEKLAGLAGLISTDGAQEMQKNSSRFPARSCQLDSENRLRIFMPVKTGPGLEPGPLSFFLSVPLVRVRDGIGMPSGGC